MDQSARVKCHRVIVLTTDFGTGSPYIGQIKATISSINASACVVDLYHDIQPQNIRQAAWFLSSFVQSFQDVIHVCVVDPGVGTQRRIVLSKTPVGYLIGPDNGVFAGFHNLPGIETVVLDRPEYWNANVSNTFHGRDIMAPVAAKLSLGEPWQNFGSPVQDSLVTTNFHPERSKSRIAGEIMLIDHYGNAISNITDKELSEIPTGCQPSFRCCGKDIGKLSHTYGDVEPGTVVALRGSGGWLEFAVVQGSFAEQVKARIGDRVTVTW